MTQEDKEIVLGYGFLYRPDKEQPSHSNYYVGLMTSASNGSGRISQHVALNISGMGVIGRLVDSRPGKLVFIPDEPEGLLKLLP